jgi:hypothetical protein
MSDHVPTPPPPAPPAARRRPRSQRRPLPRVLRVPRAFVLWVAVLGISVGAVAVTLLVVAPVLSRSRPVAFVDIAGVKSAQHIDLGTSKR